MPNTLSMATSRVWQNTAPPGVSETSAELANFFLDTTSKLLYLCTNPSAGVQTWAQFPYASATPTQHGVQIGDASGYTKSLSVASTGTVLTGVTGSDPVFSATPSVTSIAIGTPTITSGSGAPGTTQPKGSLYLRTDGSGANDRAYIATDSSGTWTAIVTVG